MRTSDTPAGHVVDGEGAAAPAERRNLRADDASMVAIDDGHRHRPVLEPVAVVGLQRDADAHRPHEGLGACRAGRLPSRLGPAALVGGRCRRSRCAAIGYAVPADSVDAMTWPPGRQNAAGVPGRPVAAGDTPHRRATAGSAYGPPMTLHGEGRRNTNITVGRLDRNAARTADTRCRVGAVDRHRPRCCRHTRDRRGPAGQRLEVQFAPRLFDLTLSGDCLWTRHRLRRRWGLSHRTGNRTACPERTKPLSLLCGGCGYPTLGPQLCAFCLPMMTIRQPRRRPAGSIRDDFDVVTPLRSICAGIKSPNSPAHRESGGLV